MSPSPKRIVTAVLVLALAMGLWACARTFELKVEDGAAPVTGVEAEKLAAGTDISALASVSSSESLTMRVAVLTDLRTRGEMGQRAAELLTLGFPERTTAVPVLVQSRKVDGADAIVVVEAFGSSGGPLIHRRLWVFDRKSGAVLRAASVR